MGEQIGEDCLAQGDLNFAGWYAPSMNIHRTPFSGRNFEYYSEDGFLSGQFGAATVAGARSKGVMTFVKHFALNDQETSRTTIATLSNEQAIREIYLAAFEPSISGGDEGTLGIMLSMNRVGLVWSGDNKGLTTNVVRGEWGFKGAIITDQASYPQAFPLLAIRAGLAGGTDMWLNSGTDNWQIDGYASNPTVMTQLRQASKHILYAVSRSLAMNGISSTAKSWRHGRWHSRESMWQQRSVLRQASTLLSAGQSAARLKLPRTRKAQTAARASRFIDIWISAPEAIDSFRGTSALGVFSDSSLWLAKCKRRSTLGMSSLE